MFKKITLNDIDFEKELNKMRENYRKKPYLQKEKLPVFVDADDEELKEVYCFYDEYEDLFKNGADSIHYGCFVQANYMLFDKERRSEFSNVCAARGVIIYSEDPRLEKNPEILSRIASTLYGLKCDDISEVPDVSDTITPNIRRIIEMLTMENTTETVELSYSMGEGEEPALVIYKPIVIFFNYLPDECLHNTIIPVLADHSKYNTIFPLPRECWTKKFKEAWLYKRVDL